MTTVYLDETADSDGNVPIVEADVEINGVSFDWLGTQSNRHEPPVSLEQVLTHELGHVLGLEDVAGASPTPSSAIMTATAHLAGTTLLPSPAELELLCATYSKPKKPQSLAMALLAIACLAVIGAARAFIRVQNKGP
jgi:hypothetical protein